MSLRERGVCREREVYVPMPKRGDERMMGSMMTSERRPFCSKRANHSSCFTLKPRPEEPRRGGGRSFGGGLLRNWELGLVGSWADPKSRGVAEFNGNDEGESAPFVFSSCEAGDGENWPL